MSSTLNTSIVRLFIIFICTQSNVELIRFASFDKEKIELMQLIYICIEKRLLINWNPEPSYSIIFVLSVFANVLRVGAFVPMFTHFRMCLHILLSVCHCLVRRA